MTTYIEGSGLLLPPPVTPEGLGPLEAVRWQLAQAVEQAETWLIDHGMDPITVAELNPKAQFAWWSEAAGFVQRDHGGDQVIVVDVPLPPSLQPPEPSAAPGPQPIPAVEGE